MLKKIAMTFTVLLVTVAQAQNIKNTSPLTINHAHAKSNMQISSEKTIFSGSQVEGSIIVKTTGKAPEIALQCKTVITGDVTFVGQPGMVRKSIDSVIKGKVNNGTVVPSTSNVKCK